MVPEKDPRGLLVTADLHYGSYPEGDECTRRLAREVCASGAEVFALAGDAAGVGPGPLQECLELFQDFSGLKLFVPGNHDLWTDGGSSYRKYTETLPRLTAGRGFHMLDVAPRVVGRTGFVGNVGWYDYSLRRRDLGVPAAEYARKTKPGVGTWMDLNFINWSYSDAEFTDLCVRTLSRHYRDVEGRADRVVAILHHLPFRELLYGETGDEALEFCRAYMGSERLGRLLLDWPALRYCVCGHRHGPDSVRKEGLRAYVAGSGYRTKRLLRLNLDSGEHEYREFAPE